MTVSTCYFQTPLGEMVLGVYQNQLCLADWQYRKMRTAIDQRIKKYFRTTFKEEHHPLLERTKQQLNEYFEGSRTVFDLPLTFAGREFQQSVWKELLKVPYGTTSSYLELSNKLRNAKAIRAVASANGANAISIIVPCHRIIGSNGDLVGYAGGLSSKKKLLELEGSLPNQQLDLF